MDDNVTGTSGDEIPDPQDATRPADAPRRVRKRTTVRSKAYKRRRRIIAGGSIAALVVVAFGAWLGYTAREAQANLTEARQHAQLAKDALLDGNPVDAERSSADADKYASRAFDNTHSIPWSIAAAVPWLGSPFETSQQISAVVKGLTSEVLTPAVAAGTSLAPNELIAAGGKVNLQPLRDAAPVLGETADAAEQLDIEAQNISEPAYLDAVIDARTQLQVQTEELAKLLGNTAIAAEIAPGMLGADGPRSYFMAFQTNAEARGTGGLLGGYGVVRANDGVARVDSLGRNSDLPMNSQPLDLGPEFAAQYGRSRPTTDSRNSNLSSHFPYAAQIWKSLWAQESGEQVDGAIATDPVALSYVLGAIGPVTMPDGEVINADNVVELTESTSYVRFANDNNARKQYLQTVAARVIDKMTGQITSPQKLLDALGRGVNERRIAVWSAHADEQAVLADTPLGHTVPEDPAPFAGVVINNQAGGKLDYYLTREIDYTAESCEGDTRRSTVTVRLTNTVPSADFPDYVAGTFINTLNVPKGTNVSALSLLATQGAQLRNVTIDGKPTMFLTGKELGHPVFDTLVPIRLGATTEVKYELTEPIVPGEARVPVQPLVDDPAVTVNVPVCGG
ncbi:MULTISPECIES: DUF4012 domain-containing protein [Rhodococcus]|uniref:DUF4012 domain-containing protein n=1 Tax=Rhodococcus oxybenzonivorans TaxID=1990687 RepID=A0AAE4V7G3_9NOCA|nr:MULTISPECIES: DUF4012 domain-containing protein [Rhodococcus]MDV7243734.1 DUF4012 domain-containing protein [Rhodococcus oxybenzonivorans]MDV7268994.1 DUF4012 domain-containing protein [Rhodococcus oxybenzonivorans]MDV7275024.1 DUF4012 domain-containing protein [Rhodococcus oxybenzonivorans]MDV7335262.1 DUF4012 domain-containing protein [Rhodococcus oxybenzonivorans]MDV7345973.1 DUF4012 domain-containing protein [Rhodococcus oxybenzonivorans]